MATLSRAWLGRVIELAHSIGIPVATHEIYPASLVGVDSTEHLGATSRRGYSPKQGPLGFAYDDVVQLFGRTSRILSPTHFGSLQNFLEKRPALRQDARIQLYPHRAREAVQNPSAVQRRSAPTPRGGSSQMIKRVFDAGERIVAATDTLVAINLHAEIASYVDARLTPYQALRAATVTTAEALALMPGASSPESLLTSCSWTATRSRTSRVPPTSGPWWPTASSTTQTSFCG